MHTFEVNKEFLLDGEPFRILSGSMFCMLHPAKTNADAAKKAAQTQALILLFICPRKNCFFSLLSYTATLGKMPEICYDRWENVLYDEITKERFPV